MKEIEVQKYIPFEYRNCIKYPGRTQYYIIKDGKVLEPIYRRRSRTGAHGEDYYKPEDVETADVILCVNISNSGKHYCYMKVQKFNIASIKKALQIHNCEALAENIITSKA